MIGFVLYGRIKQWLMVEAVFLVSWFEVLSWLFVVVMTRGWPENWWWMANVTGMKYGDGVCMQL